MKNKEKFTGGIFFVLAILVVVFIVARIYSFHFGSEKKQIIAGAVFIGKCDDNGWNESHYRGISLACKRHDGGLEVMEQVSEDRDHIKAAIRKLVNRGSSVIFLTSFGYGRYAADIAKEFPNVAFYCISGEEKTRNCTSYFARMYQVRYLSGIVAGAASKTGIHGVVAAMPVSETNRGINAYTLGVRRSDPDARVIVCFTGSWQDERAEEKAVRLLAKEGADVITYHEDKAYAIDTAEELGLYSIGYNGVYGDYSDRFLTAAVFDWKALYERVLGDYMRGRTNFADGYWLGLSENVVSLYPYSDLVSKKTRKLVEREKARIQTWRDVFSGEIYDNTGVLRCGADERIRDEELFNKMEWFVDGVEIYGDDQ